MFNIFKKSKNTEQIKTESSNDLIKQNEEESKKFKIQVDRNLQGKELEKEGKVEEAIKLYEENIRENFEGNGPYDRLAIIYRKRKSYDEEKRVLEKAIKVFEENVSIQRQDREPKLNRFKDRLKDLNEKYL